MSIKIYVEGGGNHERTVRQCRSGFAKYFQKVVPVGRQPRIVASGSRQSAYDDFCTAIKNESHKYDFILLVIDSEEQVQNGHTTWQHVKTRDNWDKPDGAAETAAHLMVQCMESWFLADKDCLVAYYGQGFLTNTLPGQPNIEMIMKSDVISSLERATRNTTKGPYHKTKHGFEILGYIDPVRVAAASNKARELNAFLSTYA